MKLKAIEFIQSKMEKFKIDKDSRDKETVSKILQEVDVMLARDLKKLFDEMFHQTWQCVVGKNFGSQIGFEENHMLYFHYQVDPYNTFAILIWKAG